MDDRRDSVKLQASCGCGDLTCPCVRPRAKDAFAVLRDVNLEMFCSRHERTGARAVPALLRQNRFHQPGSRVWLINASIQYIPTSLLLRRTCALNLSCNTIRRKHTRVEEVDDVRIRRWHLLHTPHVTRCPRGARMQRARTQGQLGLKSRVAYRGWRNRACGVVPAASRSRPTYTARTRVALRRTSSTLRDRNAGSACTEMTPKGVDVLAHSKQLCIYPDAG